MDVRQPWNSWSPHTPSTLSTEGSSRECWLTPGYHPKTRWFINLYHHASYQNICFGDFGWYTSRYNYWVSHRLRLHHPRPGMQITALIPMPGCPVAEVTTASHNSVEDSVAAHLDLTVGIWHK